jgi:hypothetical protein
MSVQGVMARAMKAGLGIDEASHKLGRLAALSGQPPTACPDECERLSWWAGYAEVVAESRLRNAELVELARAHIEWLQ